MYPTNGCQISIGECINNLTYSRNDVISLNASIRFDNIGTKNEKENISSTVWTIIFPNGTSGRLSCPGINNTCLHMLPGFMINVSISSDHLDDSAILAIDSANYNFTIIHTFHLEVATGLPDMKVFNFHHIPSKYNNIVSLL